MWSWSLAKLMVIYNVFGLTSKSSSSRICYPWSFKMHSYNHLKVDCLFQIIQDHQFRETSALIKTPFFLDSSWTLLPFLQKSTLPGCTSLLQGISCLSLLAKVVVSSYRLIMFVWPLLLWFHSSKVLAAPIYPLWLGNAYHSSFQVEWILLRIFSSLVALFHLLRLFIFILNN